MFEQNKKDQPAGMPINQIPADLQRDDKITPFVVPSTTGSRDHHS